MLYDNTLHNYNLCDINNAPTIKVGASSIFYSQADIRNKKGKTLLESLTGTQCMGYNDCHTFFALFYEVNI